METTELINNLEHIGEIININGIRLTYFLILSTIAYIIVLIIISKILENP